MFVNFCLAEEKGKWWVVGSAWTGNNITEDKSSNKINDNETNVKSYSQKLLQLARSQRMNTDVRRNIFCILMSAEVRDSIMSIFNN